MKKTRWSLGRLAGLELFAEPSALLGSIAIAVLAGAVSRSSGRPAAQATATAVLAAPLHWLSDLHHHLGHSLAARRTGHPMRGVHFWGVLGTSLYPHDEPDLPAEIHIRRALGGPIASSLLALAALMLRFVLPQGQLVRDLALLVTLENLVLGPGALFPLPSTDGGTLRTWLPRRGLPAGTAR